VSQTGAGPNAAAFGRGDEMAGLSAIRVLIVDDNSQMRLLVRSMLRAAGIVHTFEAGDVAEGLEILRLYGVDIVLLDLHLQGEDGIAFAQHVRFSRESPNPFVALIMMTCHSQRTQVAAARDAGVNSFLAKPISGRSLLEHIFAAINDQRPFVRCDTFFGPDRRRSLSRLYHGPWRRAGERHGASSLEDSLDLDAEFAAGPRAARAS
jgi:two-component system chemotaxis response regulator CheY